MATSRHVMLMVIATLVVLFVGSADAAKSHDCPYGYMNCDHHKPDCETNILNDVKNCGGCGTVCYEKPHSIVKCEHKRCVYKHKCGADTDRDVYNCGKCGHKCKEIPHYTVKCEHRRCVYKRKCHADTKNDVNNCGYCGNKCKVQWKYGQVTCKDGHCKQQCKYGYKYDEGKKWCVPKKHH